MGKAQIDYRSTPDMPETYTVYRILSWSFAAAWVAGGGVAIVGTRYALAWPAITQLGAITSLVGFVGLMVISLTRSIHRFMLLSRRRKEIQARLRAELPPPSPHGQGPADDQR